jgi:hypothetical protein
MLHVCIKRHELGIIIAQIPKSSKMPRLMREVYPITSCCVTVNDEQRVRNNEFIRPLDEIYFYG